MKNNRPYLSVIVPAFNEQSRIADSLYRIKDYLFSFINNADQSDDITMLAVYREPKS